MYRPFTRLLSVVIPTLNEAENLPALLCDLGRQQNISLEIIVGDGGSTDTTRSVAESYGAVFVNAGRGRGVQMNSAALKASGEYILFLHADSRMDDPHLLCNAVQALRMKQREPNRIAGHFRLRFIRSSTRHDMAYRYVEGKTAFNRTNTTNGDQGLLLSREFFRHLGGFDESMPFLEDQRIAEKIRSLGTWITLPGYLETSARRFEAEGFHRRYILMSMIMGLHSVGAEDFFARAPEVYKVQQDTGTLLLSSYFSLIRRMMCDDWGVGKSLQVFLLLGRYVRQNSWQLFYFIDVIFQTSARSGRYPFLNLHDRFIAPSIAFKVFDMLAGLLCFIWFFCVLAPYFRIVDRKYLTDF